MGAYSRIRALLEPLRLYDFEAGGIGRAELVAASRAIDEFAGQLDLLCRNLSPFTAEEEGVAAYQQLLDLYPPGDLDARRDAIVAMLTIGPPSLSGLRRLLKASGVEVGVRESNESRRKVEIFFPGVAGVPDDFERIDKIIARLLPCHLLYEYIYNYITWLVFERRFRSWTELEESGLSWNAIELIIE